MTAASTTTAALTGGVALLERAMAYTLGGLALVTADAMTAPSPCREWDLRGLLLHMNASLQAVHEAITLGHLRLDEAGYPDPDGDFGDPTTDPVASLRARGCAMIGGWANAQAPGDIFIADRVLTPGIVAATGAVEVAVHGWDVARACGQDRPIPAELADELLELCTLVVTDGDRPTRFATPLDLPGGAGPSERLLCFLGRHPR
ncbi:MAG: hypothetical protein QOE19_4048 [Actinomycetota bacterium]|nr:hypothetical protein [Actinomycetota bacterium]